jgi:hypothetical protein
LMGLPLYIICFFSLKDVNILSLFSVLVLLMIIHCGEVIFWSSLFDVLEASYTWKGKSFSRFGKFCHYFIEYITYTFGLHLFSFDAHDSQVWSFDGVTESCIFLSQLLSCLTKISSVFFFLQFLFYPQALRFCFHLF